MTAERHMGSPGRASDKLNVAMLGERGTITDTRPTRRQRVRRHWKSSLLFTAGLIGVWLLWANGFGGN